MSNNKNSKHIVRTAYGKIARENSSCCGPSSCCDDQSEYLKSIGYSQEEIKAIPSEANLSLGCGNPIGMSQIQEGETVLDLGCGAGTDCFLAAKKVGPNGKVIGVDMTPEMIEKARENVQKNGLDNVDFRLGEIENLPLGDSTVDLVISNCVINLSADKSRVFKEIHRVLKSSGRISISDIALTDELPEPIKNSEKAYTECIAGALLIPEYEQIVINQGFKDVKIIEQESSACVDSFTNDPIAQDIISSLKDHDGNITDKLAEIVKSVTITGSKK